MSARKSGFAEVDGAKIYYEVEGSGDPVVLIHQRGVDLRVWDDQSPAFSRRYTVVRYDRRHWGKSQVESRGYPTAPSDLEGLKQWLEDQPLSPAPYEDLWELLDHLGIGRAHLLGLHDGGEVALEFALEYPQRVGGLVLVDTVVSSVGSAQQFENLAERGLRKAAELQEDVLEEALGKVDVTGIVEWVLDDPSYAASTETALQRLRQIYTDNASANLMPGDHNVRRMSPPAGERLEDVKAPTLLILTGERPPYVSELDRALAEGIGAPTTVVTMPDASPTVNMDRPEEFNRTVMNFLDDL
ncbi:2-hydroxy-6-oxononadienedioate/2-hydroxy-6- oxononatrienedioate hydrolase [Rubrobacter xylanophilus DSM 9941]|uniref:alpha/beta fold hydrolase n=1 Tax=Rubrobacter xylanophilus TaxID=49319 RepID=UPI001C6449FD|nr:alpha/beta hydrolase [Rubrobacter xylanophilus]QYJ16272.1 2-hydroxy-6-oxononadienedioate/2-hydroxy-6- oxononatrienedioate hydrolase [Rubrobacter xylanophilus DSM 9941]